MINDQTHSVPFILIRREFIEQDAEIIGKENKLGKTNNNGRKILATECKPEFGEIEMGDLILDGEDQIWKVPAVCSTGEGGLEVATFTEFSGQDRHYHNKSIEIYTVLRGKLRIYINDKGPFELNEMDEVVIFPGTVHEVLQEKRRTRNPGEHFDLLVRVHALNCFGVADKYVQLNPQGEWLCWSELPKEEREKTYKKQDSYI